MHMLMGLNRLIPWAKSLLPMEWSPFPTLYKKRIQVGGGVNQPQAINPGQQVRIGTTKGWAGAPEEIGGPEGVNVTFDEYQNSEDETLTKVRKVIRGILDQQEDARNGS